MSTHAPQLRTDLTIVEQRYRDEKSFVVKDPNTHGYFRFRPIEMQVMRLFDGIRSTAQIAEALIVEGLRISHSTVDGFARKLSSLGLLERSLQERTTQQLERLRNERQRRRSFFRGELLRMRFSFGDPDRLLTRCYPYVRWCFTPTFVVTSIVAFLAYVAIVIVQRDAFAERVGSMFSASTFTPWSIFLLVATFAILTAIHEFGHAFACKHFGGEVHEMGAMLLLFLPAFYANVNDAWSFPDRRARLWVTTAGPWIELFVTSVLAIIWFLLAPGSVIGDIAVASMMVGGLLNILTNLNPLLPLDGYFALGDWLEIPNLRQRAAAFASAGFRRHVLREEVALPDVTPQEARILFGYGTLAFLYSTGFLLFIASKAISGINQLLGALAAGILVFLVMFKMRRVLGALTSAVRRVTRVRASNRPVRRLRLAGIGGVILLLLAAVVPCHLTAGGSFVVTPVASMTFTAPANGVVAAVFVREGDALRAGAPVAQLIDFDLEREQVAREFRTDSLTSLSRRAQAHLAGGASAGFLVEAEGASALSNESRARLQALRVSTRLPGIVATVRPEQWIGRNVQFGDSLLTLVDTTQLEAVVRLSGSGAVQVRVGDTVTLIGYQRVTQPIDGVVASISPIARELAADQSAIEARVVLSPAARFRVGATGEARVQWRRATVLTALVWHLRSALRSDLFL